MRRAAQKIAFADSLDWWIDTWGSNKYIDEYALGGTPTLPLANAYRHRGRMNAACYDGHVETMPRAQVDRTLDAQAINLIWSPYQP